MMKMMIGLRSDLKLASLKDAPLDHLGSPVPLLFLLRQGHHASLLMLLNLIFLFSHFMTFMSFMIKVLLQLQINICTTS